MSAWDVTQVIFETRPERKEEGVGGLSGGEGGGGGDGGGVTDLQASGEVTWGIWIIC